MFIKLNILDSKKIIIDYKQELLYIDNCREIQVLIKVIFVKNKVKRTIRLLNKIVIFVQLTTIILIQLCEKKLFKSCNLLFIFTKDSRRFETSNRILLYIIDVNLWAI